MLHFHSASIIPVHKITRTLEPTMKVVVILPAPHGIPLNILLLLCHQFYLHPVKIADVRFIFIAFGLLCRLSGENKTSLIKMNRIALKLVS